MLVMIITLVMSELTLIVWNVEEFKIMKNHHLGS